MCEKGKREKGFYMCYCINLFFVCFCHFRVGVSVFSLTFDGRSKGAEILNDN